MPVPITPKDSELHKCVRHCRQLAMCSRTISLGDPQRVPLFWKMEEKAPSDPVGAILDPPIRFPPPFFFFALKCPQSFLAGYARQQ